MNWIKSLSKNIAALLLGLLVVFILMEGILRIYNPFDFRVKGNKIVLPANKKYTIKKNMSRKSHEKFDDVIIHTKNSLGFRGEEPPEDYSDYMTILTVGGSTTECTLLSDGKTWTDVLGSRLKSKFNKVWINNAGLDGHSTFGHIVLMEDYIVKLKPDIVLFLIGANEIGLEDLGDQDREIMKDRIMLNSVKGFAISMANNSEVFSLAVNLCRYWKSRSIGLEHVTLDFEIFKNKKYVPPSIEQREIQRRSLEEHNAVYAKAFKKRLEKLIQISKAHNIEPVLMTQPSFYGDFVDDVTGIDFKFTEFNWVLLEVYNDVTREVGEHNNVPVIDLARELPKSSGYYYDWFHFTNEGAEKVAEIVYNILYPYLKSK